MRIPEEINMTIKLKNWWKKFRQKTAEPEHRSVLERLKAVFEEKRILYRLIPHSEVYTAQELAASIHTPGRKVAKVVIVRADGKYAMAVLPSHCQVDLSLFAQMIGAGEASLAKEAEIAGLFPDCELGAMPPWGNFYGLPVYIDQSLAQQPLIVFQAGSHHEVVEMRYDDYERLVRPQVGHFALEPMRKASGF